MKRTSIGEHELDLLRFIAESKSPLSIRQMVEKYGALHKLARTTILTMCERLRQKGYLTREEIKGLNFYTSTMETEELLQYIVRDFVQNKLNGSLSPFVVYLTQTVEANEQDLKEVKRLLYDLEKERNENG